MSAPDTLTELKLSDDMQRAVNTAFESGRAIAISYVDEAGAPHLSYRGSTQAYSDSELAIWVRNPEGRILDAIRANPAVALIYGNFDPDERGFMIFEGRARIVEDETVRKRVYERAHEFERNQDPDRKGVAMLIELDRVNGFFGGNRLQMRREPG